MKRILLSLAAFVMIIASANAQETSFGVKLGPNFATLGGDIEENEMKIGFHLGGVANIMITESFAFAPELLFSTQGTKWEEGDDKLKYNLTYLNLPLLARYYFTEGFSVHAGPEVGFLLSAKAKEEFDGEEEKEDIEGLKGLDFGVALGAGYELDNGLNFGARYNIGLANINDEGDDKVSNQVFQVYAGFNF